MNNTKVYQLIQVLPLSDRAKISAFLNSEPAGKTTLISSLYDFICIHLHSSEENLPREKVWNSLYPGQPFRDSTLRKLCADLAKNLENAFSILHLSENHRAQNLHYLQFLRDRNYPSSLFKREVK